ncbi:MAG: geranylgeranyl reductase family protein [Acidobacteriota bacterium]|nr:geranylgeranyl reductase family protein [Acidobacteriota bacterium]
MDNEMHDVLVIGAGPGGSACAYWLADAGWDVAVVEKKRFPREKTCGDGLTPRSVRQLTDMGLAGALAGAHRHRGLRSCGFGLTMELAWPRHPSFPDVGYVITRHDLDQLVAERAEKAGAVVYQGTEAAEPVLEDGDEAPGRLPRCTGALVVDRATRATRFIRARYVVVADGANSRFGRALGATRDRGHPLGMALRGYFRSPRHDDEFIESHLDLRVGGSEVVPGYGWIFPLGDGRVNVGVGLLSAEGKYKGINTSHLMSAFLDQAPRSWGLSPQVSCGPPTGGKLPMGLSVAPRVGPTVVAVGDAAGAINPMNGEGIAYGYETGRLAAACLGRALSGEGTAALDDYERQLEDAYGLYYRVARDFVALISHPRIMEACVRTGMRSQTVMGVLLKIMGNLMRGDEIGAAERTYQGLAAIARAVPGL